MPTTTATTLTWTNTPKRTSVPSHFGIFASRNSGAGAPAAPALLLLVLVLKLAAARPIGSWRATRSGGWSEGEKARNAAAAMLQAMLQAMPQAMLLVMLQAMLQVILQAMLQAMLMPTALSTMTRAAMAMTA